MATETIKIVVSETGARVVKRNIENIGTGARTAQSGVQLLSRALGTVVAAVGLRQLIQLSDTFVNIQNRLRTVTTGTQELASVTDELFAIANRTRGSFEATAEVFSRTALAVKELGISQQETLAFTESLNQAVILSGASAMEANNALIQLSQGLASGTLRGDELRSVLEQLPVVSDVIAKSLGVTRGELRTLGEEGVISAKAIIRSFAEAREELVKRFAETIPTISQSFQFLENQVILLVGAFSEAGGIFSTLASGIQSLADGVGVLGNNLDTVTTVFGVLALVALSRFLGPMIARLGTATAAQLTFAKAVVTGNAVLIKGAAADLQRAQAKATVAAAIATETAAVTKSLQVRTANLSVLRAEANAERLLIATKIELQAGIAAVTGRTAVLTRLRATQTALLQREVQATKLLSIAKTELAVATGVSTAAAGVATVAQTAVGAALVRTTLLARAAGVAMLFLSRTMALLGGPVGLLLLVASSMFLFGRETKKASTTISEQDSSLAALNLRLRANVAGTRAANIELQNQAIAQRNVLRAKKVDAEIEAGLIAGRILDQKNLIAALGDVPKKARVTGRTGTSVVDQEAIDELKAARDGLKALEADLLVAATAAGATEAEITKLKEGIAAFTGTVKEQTNKALDDLRGKLNGVFKANLQLRRMSEGLEIQIKDESITRAEANKLLERQKFLLQDQLNPLAALNRELDFENSLLGKSASEREIANSAREIQLDLDRKGVTVTLETAEALARANAETAQQKAALDEVRGPLDDYNEGLKTQKALLADNLISNKEFTTSVRDLRLAFLETQTDGASGFERGLLKLQDESENLGKAMEDLTVKGFNGAADALTEFVTTGKLSFKSLIDSMIKDLIRLAIKKAILKVLGSFGVPGLNGGGDIQTPGLNNGGTIQLPGLNDGGSFQVGGAGGIDQNLLSINGRPAARVSKGETIRVIPNKGGKGSGGVIINFEIDARGAEIGVEERIAAAIEEATPLIVSEARQKATGDIEQRLSRRFLG